jgi:hypothetical protein
MRGHWDARAPDRQRSVAFAGVYRMLNTPISVFISLPIESLSGLARQTELDRIRAMERPHRRTRAAA